MENKKLQEYVSKRIRLLRLQKGMTQEQLAEKAGLGFNYVYKLENKPTNVKIDTIEKVINALDVGIDTFFDISFLDKTPDLSGLVDNISNLPKDKQAEVIEAFNKLIEQIK